MRDGRDDRSEETDPFARLERTHRRLEERLAVLEQAAADLLDPARRDGALADVDDVMAWLDRAGVRHHDDEEQSLFPRLASVASLQTIVAALEAEHRALDAATHAVDALLGGQIDDAGAREIIALAAKLGDVYRAHLDREELELFPAARAALAPAVQEEIGREMIARRPRTADNGRGGGGGRG